MTVCRSRTSVDDSRRAGRLSPRRGGVAVALFLTASVALAEIEVVTPDGRRVLLHDDKTWEYVEADEEAKEPRAQASLVLKNRRDGSNSCIFGVKLTNTLVFEIKSLVPKFSAITADGVSYQTNFQSFNGLRPTNSQYKEIEFRGISCAKIASLLVSGGDRCTMGNLTKFSSEKGECLSHIDVRASDIIPFSK